MYSFSTQAGLLLVTSSTKRAALHLRETRYECHWLPPSRGAGWLLRCKTGGPWASITSLHIFIAPKISASPPISFYEASMSSHPFFIPAPVSSSFLCRRPSSVNCFKNGCHTYLLPSRDQDLSPWVSGVCEMRADGPLGPLEATPSHQELKEERCICCTRSIAIDYCKDVFLHFLFRCIVFHM